SKRIQMDADREAEHRLIQANLRLVVSIARQYHSRAMSLDDLIQSGNYGLCRAAKLYDALAHPTTPFGSYAALLIRQAIAADLGDTDMVSIPDAVVRARKAVRRFADTFLSEHGREPTPEEVMTAVGLTKSQYKAVEASRYSISSLDEPIADEDG